MIKFFRKIRHKLLSENKFSKYLIYAIGEIILVVIGILIALSINNWNANRINTKKESIVLLNIHNEFKKNKIQLDTILKKHKIVKRNCTKIINLFPIKSISEPIILDSLPRYLFFTYGAYTFNPSQSSINALTSTSSFDIIENDELRNLLISWNDLVEDYQEEEIKSSDFELNRYDPFIAKHFDFNFDFKDSRNNLQALQTLEFEYLVNYRLWMVNEIIEESGEIKKLQYTLDKIIELTETQRN